LLTELIKDFKRIVTVEADFWGVSQAQVLSEFTSKEGHSLSESFLDLRLNKLIFLGIQHVKILNIRSLVQFSPELQNIYIWVFLLRLFHQVFLKFNYIILSSLGFKVKKSLGIGRVLIEFHLLGNLKLVNTVQSPKGIHN
jgi:hypothetical protein